MAASSIGSQAPNGPESENAKLKKLLEATVPQRAEMARRWHGLDRCWYKGYIGINRWVRLGVIADTVVQHRSGHGKSRRPTKPHPPRSHSKPCCLPVGFALRGV